MYTQKFKIKNNEKQKEKYNVMMIAEAERPKNFNHFFNSFMRTPLL